LKTKDDVLCILHGAGGEFMVVVVSGGKELELQVKTGNWAGRTPTSSVLEFIVHKQ